MSVKVFFVGNLVGGDDGIGPYLYQELKDDSRLKDFELFEAGVIGFDIISDVEEDDQLIIVDAVRTEGVEFGEIIVLTEEDLSKNMSVVSQHDFGVDQTATMLRAYRPNLKAINIIGVKVNDITEFSTELSQGLKEKIESIKEGVVQKIEGLV